MPYIAEGSECTWKNH